jgi:hypothetical protein
MAMRMFVVSDPAAAVILEGLGDWIVTPVLHGNPAAIFRRSQARPLGLAVLALPVANLEGHYARLRSAAERYVSDLAGRLSRRITT